jgi:hypothetical protein
MKCKTCGKKTILLFPGGRCEKCFRNTEEGRRIQRVIDEAKAKNKGESR